MKRLAIVAIALAILILVPLSYLILTFAEPQNMSQNGIRARIFVPEEVRTFKWPELCEAVQFDKSYQECTGGICGEHYYIHLRSNAAPKVLDAAFERLLNRSSQDGIMWSRETPITNDGCRELTGAVYYAY